MGNKFLKPRSSEPSFTKPTGLYPKCEWDDKTVKKLINKKKIAPRYPGREDQAPDLDECPICFLWYPGGLNRSTCCKQQICTECFLQFKKPAPAKPIQCPFCNAQNYTVKYSGCKTKEEREAIEQEEQKVIEAKIRMRKEEVERDAEREQKIAAERERRLREGPSPEELAAEAAAAEAAAERARQNQARLDRERLGRRTDGGAGEPYQHRSGRPRAPPNAGFISASTNGDAALHQGEASEDDDELGEGDFQNDIEDLMVMEAIRLSLLDNANHRRQTDDDESIEAGPRQMRASPGGSQAEASTSVRQPEEEDWPAVTWGEDSQEDVMLQPAAGAAQAPASSAFEAQVRNLGIEMEHDTALFELLVSGNDFFSGRPPLTSSAFASASSQPPSGVTAIEVDSSIMSPGRHMIEIRNSEQGHDDKVKRDEGGDDHHSGDENEGHSGISLEFVDEESSVVDSSLESSRDPDKNGNGGMSQLPCGTQVEAAASQEGLDGNAADASTGNNDLDAAGPSVALPVHSSEASPVKDGEQILGRRDLTSSPTMSSNTALTCPASPFQEFVLRSETEASQVGSENFPSENAGHHGEAQVEDTEEAEKAPATEKDGRLDDKDGADDTLKELAEGITERKEGGAPHVRLPSSKGIVKETEVQDEAATLMMMMTDEAAALCDDEAATLCDDEAATLCDDEAATLCDDEAATLGERAGGGALG